MTIFVYYVEFVFFELYYNIIIYFDIYQIEISKYFLNEQQVDIYYIENDYFINENRINKIINSSITI